MPIKNQVIKTPAEWILKLRDTPLFRDIPEDQLIEISKYTAVTQYGSEEIIFREGDVGEQIVFQLDGRSLLFLGNVEKPTVLTEGKPGDCFGEMAVIDQQPRSASLKTIEPTHFLTIDRLNFEQLIMGGHSRFSINLMKFLSQRIRQTDILLIEMLQKKNSTLEETLALLKKTQNELLQKERLSTLGRMASMIVHDLKSPLTSVSTLGYVLSHQDLSNEQRINYGKLLNEEITRLVEMIEEILLFAKDQSNLHLKPTDVSQLLKRLRDAMERSTQGWDVQWNITDDVKADLHLDSDRIYRALANLCKNSWEALKAAQTQLPQIDVDVHETEESLEFSVRDNGPGIPEEIHDSLFDAFVTSGKPQGTGLGLAIVKKVVNDHRGLIECKSSPENGTTFKISIPKIIPLSS